MNDKRIEEIQAQITALQNELNTMKQLSQCDVPVTERIKTFRDACEVLGDEHPLVKEYWGVVNVDIDITQDLIAYLKLRIIAAALNEDWKPKFTQNEFKYFPYFKLFTQEEYDCMSKEWRQKYPLIFQDNTKYLSADCGLVCSYSIYTWTHWSIFNSHVTVKSPELAIYFGTQFFEIWRDYIFK